MKPRTLTVVHPKMKHTVLILHQFEDGTIGAGGDAEFIFRFSSTQMAGGIIDSTDKFVPIDSPVFLERYAEQFSAYEVKIVDAPEHPVGVFMPSGAPRVLPDGTAYVNLGEYVTPEQVSGLFQSRNIDCECIECGISFAVATDPDGTIADGHAVACPECRAFYMFSCDAESPGTWNRREDWDGPREGTP